MEKQTNQLTNKKMALILGVTAIIAAAVVAVVVLTRSRPPQVLPVAEASGIPVIDEDNLSEIQGDIKDKVAKGMFETHMNTTWKFPDGKHASSNAVMGNAASNNYPFWFEVILKDTDEVVFTSSLLPVGTNIKKIVLDQDLDKGEYDAVVKIHMVDENNEPVEGNAGVNITLVIEK